MKYGLFIVYLLFCHYSFCMDEEYFLDADSQSVPEVVEIPVPPEDVADFEAMVEFLRTLQNSKTCPDTYKREQVQKAYQRYYLCPTFSRAGGKKVLVLLADELDMDLQFSCSQSCQTLKFACQDIRAVGKYMAVLGTIGGLGVVMYWLDARNAAMDAVTVANSSSYYENQMGYNFVQPCSPCTESFSHDWRDDSYYPVPHYSGVANCSNILDIVNQSFHEISAACLDKVRPFFWIDAKNYFQVTCWRDGSLDFCRCNIEQVKSYLQNQVASSYQFVLGCTGMLAAIPATMYCVAAGIDGGCVYVSKKILQGYQYCRGQKTAKVKVREEKLMPSSLLSPDLTPILLDEDEEMDEEEDEV